MTIVAIVLALLISVIGVVLFARAIGAIVGVVKVGQPTLGRTDSPAERWKHMLAETLGHTRMLQWSRIGVAHWFVMVGFGALFFTLVTAYGQLFNPGFALPLIGHWIVYEWISEIIAALGWLAITFLIILRMIKGHDARTSRFFGSNVWQARYVEWTIWGIMTCVLVLRALEFQYLGAEASRWHFPIASWLLPAGLATESVGTAIKLVAALKIIISMAWFCVIGLHTTMGVAWHRFTAFPNIWFKRESSGKPALGALPPINAGGKPLDFEELDDLDEDAALGASKIEDFTWKGLLDFTSCTECGRCQSQCPAWATDKPLSPKLMIMGLREHAYAKAPYLQAAEEARASLPEDLRTEAERPLVGAMVAEDNRTAESVREASVAQAHGAPIQIIDGVAGVVDPDVLWACTNCGACVQQCPVDIEHVDHIMDMRRHQVLMESDFPTELNQLFKGLESKGNPWNMNARKRMEWAKDLEFEVPVVGEDVEDLTEVEYLFWVGCAGSYEDRAIKTTKAVAELLHTAGVSFAVLGNGETCTGDPARRAGNEFVFQQLAAENKETLTEAKASKVITTCAHCLNTLKNEYPQVGVELEVVHHTQLLNRLVRDGRLTPVAPPAGEVGGRTITYHDPCFLGRHNEVYDAPRELLSAIPGAELAEMPRNRTTSFCCGAGGAQMWMEEKIGTRINLNRTEEALQTLEIAGVKNSAAGSGGERSGGAIATACPFCRVMISDGLSAKQDDGQGAGVEVQDVAQLLLAGVRRSTDSADS
ncbi:heterodisulfide reductase-related iron-sulfur binding cluster [Propionibacteriaceae bacterium Y1685]